MAIHLDTNDIRQWRSIVTLIVFIITNIVVLFPFHVPIYVPRPLANALLDTLSACRVIPPRRDHTHLAHHTRDGQNGKPTPFVRLRFPLNFVTAPLIADLFLLAILAIGRQEVHDGTIGANNISPADIMAFFLTLAYIAISIDASGLIRYLAFKVLQKGGKVGHRLFFYLYIFFFLLGSFIGNDPIILSGTAFLAYMTRVSNNIVHPRAWIHSQFAVANIASAILVSSNPTNLVLAGAFKIKFIVYTANMIVPVVITAIVLFPFLLYIIFADESLIPISIKMHELSDEEKNKKPVNPNIPNARGNAEEEMKRDANDEQGKQLSLEEIMNPFLDKGGAAFGSVIMAATLITLLALNASSQAKGEHPVFWVTLPAAFVMFCWDVGFGWWHRKETRKTADRGREDIERARAERASRGEEVSSEMASEQEEQLPTGLDYYPAQKASPEKELPKDEPAQTSRSSTTAGDLLNEKHLTARIESDTPLQKSLDAKSSTGLDQEGPKAFEQFSLEEARPRKREPKTLVSLISQGYRWAQETFPTVTAVLAHLPFALIPFAFSMFVLVQALVTKGWVPVFAYGWDRWVDKTGTVGAIGGMGFLSVCLCNFAGTNIGTTILLSRVIQAWEDIHRDSGIPITNRTFWATVYSMAIGVNYGAFSTAFSASLAGLLWRDILSRKHIHVRRLDFARVNLPIIAIAMAVGCTALVAEVYIIRDKSAYII
ncbi:hypothetical protein BP5796_11319 [Coleophoma crateriformis]|uniref:Citrate transporter-like domain-containing protein n=1 Tax=Coleophoma crateriformis TaxID=565419 RepID=A0A3D8QI63_9HELO|nr:hypothetical protein BP5796_11319 [Coleophoma crateriformis]